MKDYVGDKEIGVNKTFIEINQNEGAIRSLLCWV